MELNDFLLRYRGILCNVCVFISLQKNNMSMSLCDMKFYTMTRIVLDRRQFVSDFCAYASSVKCMYWMGCTFGFQHGYVYLWLYNLISIKVS